jgi:hypothetical protein
MIAESRKEREVEDSWKQKNFDEENIFERKCAESKRQLSKVQSSLRSILSLFEQGDRETDLGEDLSICALLSRIESRIDPLVSTSRGCLETKKRTPFLPLVTLPSSIAAMQEHSDIEVSRPLWRFEIESHVKRMPKRVESAASTRPGTSSSHGIHRAGRTLKN